MPDAAGRPPVRPAAARSPLVGVVAALVAVEAAVLLLGAVYLVHGLLTEDATEPVAAVFLVVMTLGFAAALVLCARGLLARSSWARSPVVVWQVLQLAAGLPAFAGGTWWAGVVVAVPAVAVLVLLFTPRVSAEVSRH